MRNNVKYNRRKSHGDYGIVCLELNTDKNQIQSQSQSPRKRRPLKNKDSLEKEDSLEIISVRKKMIDRLIVLMVN